ncbi:conserved hypothetical protein [Desulfosarcina cetonica]|nr:conserved hypothetical protein [Desulfosarcina cetonica]
MADELFTVDHHGVAGVIAALETNDDIRIGGQQIDNFSLSFIAPLRPDNNNVCHLTLLHE